MPPKKITIVRHGQGYHNLTRNYELRDPLLTPLGHEQCAKLSAKYPHHQTVDVVIASPLRRTIQTAAFSFGPALARPEVPFLLDPKLQEVGSHGADVGLDVQDLKTWLKEAEKEGEGKVSFDWGKIDAREVQKGWNSKQGYWAYEVKALRKRAADVRNALFQRTENHVVIVAHGAIAHFITEDWDVEDPCLGTTWYNCEVRDYVFREGSKEDDAHLVETEESLNQRPPYDGPKYEFNEEDLKDPHVMQDLEQLEEK